MKNRIRHRALVRHFVAPEFIDWFNQLTGREQLYVLLMGDMLANSSSTPEMPDSPDSDEILKVYLNTYLPEKGEIFKNSELITALTKHSPEASLKLELAFYSYYELIFSNTPGKRYRLEGCSDKNNVGNKPLNDDEHHHENFVEFSRFDNGHSVSTTSPEQPEVLEPLPNDEQDAPSKASQTSHLKDHLKGMF